MERQLNFVNNLNNRVRKRYYIDDNSEFDLVPQEENNQVYSINDNQLFQMEVANEEEEISGNIVSFMGQQKTKIEKLQANIQPVQNLNGYDNPWPAGGGKNLLPQQEITGGMSNVQVSSNGDKVTINGTASAYGHVVSANTITLDAGTYFLKIFVVSGSFTSGYVQYQLRSVDGTITYASTVNGLEFTLQERTELKPRVVYSNGTVISNYIIRTMVVSGSTAPTAFSPYSNICPISGWDAVNVHRARKNLGKISADNLSSNQRATIDYTDSGVTVAATNNYTRAGWLFSVKEGQRYTVSFKAVATPGAYRIYLGTEDNATATTSPGYLTFISLPQEETFYTRTFTATNSGVFFVGVYVVATGFDRENPQTATISNFQLELGSTATEYEPYTGETYPVDLGQTVYGGTLDVVNGKMTVDRVGITPTIDRLQSINTYGIANFRFELSDASTKAAVQAKAICSALKYQTTLIADTTELGFILSSASTGYLRIPQEIANTKETAQSWVSTNNVIVVYYLATPFELTLTPEQISTLQGTNNVWSDVGPITLKYSTKGLTTYLLKP